MTPRTRTHNRPAVLIQQGYRYKDADQLGTQYYSSGQTSTFGGNERTSIITDEPSKRFERYHGDVYQYVETTVEDRPLIRVNYKYDRTWSNEYSPAIRYQGNAKFSGMSKCPRLSEFDSASYATRALRQMLPKVNEGTSLVNFILELKDLRRMFHVWNKRHSTKKNFASGYLNLMFGWVPFISDLKDIYKALTTFSAKLKWLREHQGRVLVRRYKRPLPGYADYTYDRNLSQDFVIRGTGSITDTSTTQMKYSRTVSWLLPPTYHATLVYRYTIENMSAVEEKIAAFTDALGIRLDPAIIWNAIPFSFVIDWVVDVGSFLRQLSPNSLGIKTEVISFCHSVKGVQIEDIRLGFTDVQTGRFLGWKLACQNFRRLYDRKRFNPNLYAILGSGIDLREASLGAALIIANAKNKKRRRPSQSPSGNITDLDPY